MLNARQGSHVVGIAAPNAVPTQWQQCSQNFFGFSVFSRIAHLSYRQPDQHCLLAPTPSPNDRVTSHQFGPSADLIAPTAAMVSFWSAFT